MLINKTKTSTTRQNIHIKNKKRVALQLNDFR